MTIDRRTFAKSIGLIGGMALAGAGRSQMRSGGGPTESQLADGRALVAAAPSIDLHSHAGRFFVEGDGRATPLGARLGRPFADVALAGARSARLGAVCLNAVADYRVLAASPLGLRAERPFAPGEAHADFRRQMALMTRAVRDGGLTVARSGADVRRIWGKGGTAAILAIEGGDFVEDRLDRLGEAAAAGVRIITIIHYRPNAVGDPQTSPPRHGGLTPFGRSMVGEMDRLGMIVDLAHASAAATAQAVALSDRPRIISHANLRLPGLDHPRLIDVDHARLVTRGGGLIGAVPGGTGVATLPAFATMVARMIDAVGVDHVAVGTDMDFGFASVVPAYADWVGIPAALLARGLSADEVRKIIGGNAMRLLDGANRDRRSI
jgi:membrane dipeptidase